MTPQWLTNKMVRILVQENAKGTPALNKMGVPRTSISPRPPEDRQVMELVYSQAVFGRPMCCRQACRERVRHCARRSWPRSPTRRCSPKPKKMKLDVEALSGEEVQAMVAQLFAMPAHIVERAKQALIYKPPAR